MVNFSFDTSPLENCDAAGLGSNAERAYENPTFVEDLVRNVALRLNDHQDVTWYKVEAENFESIHSHNAYACIEKG